MDISQEWSKFYANYRFREDCMDLRVRFFLTLLTVLPVM